MKALAILILAALFALPVLAQETTVTADQLKESNVKVMVCTEDELIEIATLATEHIRALQQISSQRDLEGLISYRRTALAIRWPDCSVGIVSNYITLRMVDDLLLGVLLSQRAERPSVAPNLPMA